MRSRAVWFATARDVGQISWISPLSLGGVKGVVEQVEWVERASRRAHDGRRRDPPLAATAELAAHDQRARRRAGLWSPFACAIAVSVVKPILLGRYLIVTAPALALLGAVTITAIRKRAVAYLLLAATLAIGAYRTVDWYRAPSVEGWRDAVAYVEGEREPGDQVFVEPREDDEPYRYYSGRSSTAGMPTSQVVWVVLGAATAEEALADASVVVPTTRYLLGVVRARDGVFVVRGRLS